MPESPRAHYQSAFAQFYDQVQEIRDTVLGQKLYDARTFQSSNIARRLFNALNELNSAVCDVHSHYGSQGPNAAWNPETPARNQPYNDPSQQTHPPTPSTKQQISALEDENRELMSIIENRNAELDQASHRLDEHSRDISEANEDIESLRRQLASEYKSNRRFDLAAEQLGSLAQGKAKVLSQKRLKNDEDGARFAEELQLEYIHESGKMLFEAARFAEAEHAIRHVLEKKKAIHNDGRLERQENRDAQLQLCAALRSQNVESKWKEAEYLYHRESLLTNLRGQNEADRTWAIRNAFEFAYLNAEQGSYVSAIKHLQEVWQVRMKASLECRRHLETQLLQLGRLLEQRSVLSHAATVLAMICEGHNGVPPGLLDHFTKQGSLLQERGEHKQAIFLLRKAWESPSMAPSEKLRLGWSYAWSLCHLKQFPEGRQILESILELSKPKTSPSEHQVRALLAYAQLNSQNFMEAEKNAQIVLDHCGPSTLSGSHTFNHANTLIRALIKYNTRERYLETYPVWQRIYAERSQIVLQPNGKEQLRKHAEVGKELATNWKRSANARGKKDPRRPPEVKRQALELENMAA